MKAASFWLFTVVIATCVVCVEESLTKGTCICDTKTENVTSGDLQELISERRLIKLALQYIEQVIVSGQPWTRLWLFRHVVLVMAIALYSPLILVAYRPSEIMGKKDRPSCRAVTNSERTAQENPPGPLPNEQQSGTEEGNNQFHTILNFQSGGVTSSLSDEKNTSHGQAVDDGETSEMVLPNNAKASGPSQKSSVSSGSSTSENVKIKVASETSIRGELVEKLADSTDTADSERIASSEGSHSTEDLVEVVTSSESVSKDTQRFRSESTDEVRMVLDGKDPVALGSWIGNCLFINSAKGCDNNKYLEILKDMARYVLCCNFPTLLILGLGDLSLLMMQYNSSSLADFLKNSFMASFFRKCRIGGGVTFLIFELFRSHYRRKLASKSINVWRSCFLHCDHVPVILRLKCFRYPCGKCKNPSPDCPTQVDIPNNIVHHMEKVTENFLKYCS